MVYLGRGHGPPTALAVPPPTTRALSAPRGFNIWRTTQQATSCQLIGPASLLERTGASNDRFLENPIAHDREAGAHLCSYSRIRLCRLLGKRDSGLGSHDTTRGPTAQGIFTNPMPK